MTNTQKLGLIIGKFVSPMVTGFGSMRLTSVPAVQIFENRIKSSGWVSANWSLASELEPFTDIVAQAVVGQIVGQMLSGVPDESVPAIAHGIVDKAVKEGKLELFEGKVTLDADDLTRLKAALDRNMPIDGQLEIEF